MTSRSDVLCRPGPRAPVRITIHHPDFARELMDDFDLVHAPHAVTFVPVPDTDPHIDIVVVHDVAARARVVGCYAYTRQGGIPTRFVPVRTAVPLDGPDLALTT